MAINIEITGEAVKTIAAHTGEGGVRHLLETLRIFAEAEMEKASAQSQQVVLAETGNPPPPSDNTTSPKERRLGRPSKTDAEKYAQLRAKELGQKKKKDLVVYRLVYCSTMIERGLDETDSRYQKEYDSLKGTSPQKMAEASLWLYQKQYEKLEGLRKIRKDLFSDECDENFKLDKNRDLKLLKRLREMNSYLGEHPMKGLLDYSKCMDIAKLWSENSDRNPIPRYFPGKLETIRSRMTGVFVHQTELLKKLNIKWEEVEEYKDQFLTVLKWVNNDILIIDDLGNITYE